jgi:acetolactate synthase-1/2/3 large subunit
MLSTSLIESRRDKVVDIHEKMRNSWNHIGDEEKDHITPEFLTICLREVINDDTVILNETITVRPTVDKLLPRNKPGTLFGNGGSALGWHGGAAIGMKLACPDKDIVALTGDGTYIFSCPTAVHWMAAKYETPFLTVIYNNQAWNAPKQITTKQHPDGFAVKTDKFWTSLTPSAQLDMVAAAAGGAFAKTVSDPKELRQALAEGREAVANGKCAVINVMLPES